MLISYFPAHFPLHNQTLESVFQLIFHYTTKHRKILSRNSLSRNSLSPEFTFQKETTFQQTNGALVKFNKQNTKTILEGSIFYQFLHYKSIKR